MKNLYISILVTVLLSNVSLGQNNLNPKENIDNQYSFLKKYSYLILLYPKPEISAEYNRNRGGNATGFFIRWKNRLFFVTNYHVLTGMDAWDIHYRNQFKYTYDSAKIRYYNDKNQPEYYAVDMNKILKERETFSFFDSPDIYVIPITKISKNAKIFSIEKYLKSSTNDVAINKIAFSYQYSLSPGNDIIKQANYLVNENNNPRQPDLLDRVLFPTNKVWGQSLAGEGLTLSQLFANGNTLIVNNTSTLTSIPNFDYKFLSQTSDVVTQPLVAGGMKPSQLFANGNTFTSNNNTTLTSIPNFDCKFLSQTSHEAILPLIGEGLTLSQFLVNGNTLAANNTTTLTSIPNFDYKFLYQTNDVVTQPLVGGGLTISQFFANGNTITAHNTTNLTSIPNFDYKFHSQTSDVAIQPLVGGGLTLSQFLVNGNTLTANNTTTLPPIPNFDYKFLSQTSDVAIQPLVGGGLTISQFFANGNTLTSNNNTTLMSIPNFDYKFHSQTSDVAIQPLVGGVLTLSQLGSDKYNLTDFNHLMKNALAINKEEEQDLYVMHNLNFETFLPTLYIGMILDPSVYNEPIVDKMNFLLTPSSYHGGSGSPIFFQCTSKLNNKEKVWIEFGGVQAAIESKFNSTIVVKPEQIISKIEELIKQN